MEASLPSIPNKRRRRSKRQIHVERCMDEGNKYVHSESFNSEHDSVNVDSLSYGTEGAVRSSWLVNQMWRSSRDDLLEEPSEGRRENGSLAMEIRHLQKQLLLTKRRLGPAAERCAEKLGDSSHSYASATSSNHARSVFEQARRVCNPYEVLGEGRNCGLNQYLFMNRSAIKLANVDAVVGFCLTKIHTSALTVNERHTFKFCDLCSAPGGFSEYILWRLRHPTAPSNIAECRGYGMSLTGSNEHGRGLLWKLHDRKENVFHDDGVGEMRQNYRICYGVDGSGDIQNWDNVVSLQQAIHNDDTIFSCHGETASEDGKVHLVLADGGFDAQRDAENQEEVAQKLVACEAAAALSLLCTGGTMVIKLFGFQTSVVRSIMRHLYFSFEHIIALKPISSRPASTERYVVCVGFHGNSIGWTGQRWSSDLYLGRPCTISNYPSDIDFGKKEAALWRYLDEFDRDLCALNLKANFAILTRMERNCLSLVEDRCVQADDNIDYEVTRVSIPLYRIAWRLDC